MPTPPKGYQLDPATQETSTVPDFIKKAIDVKSILQQVTAPLPTSTETPGTETVAQAFPGRIAVYNPKRYDERVRNHEMTHELQYAHENGNIPLPFGYEIPMHGSKPAAPLKYEVGDLRNYNYGGQDGLVAARQSGKTMADFNEEQQADIVADYKAKQDAYLANIAAGKTSPAELRAMYETRQAYHPFVQQLANVPTRLRDTLPSLKAILGFGPPPPLTPAPEAPGLPSYDTAGLGYAPADPLMGGSGAVIGKKTRKIQQVADELRANSR